MRSMVFDIETVPDVELGRRLYDLNGLNDEDVAKAMFAKRRQKTGNEFLAHHMHQIVAISIVLRDKDHFRVWSLGNEESTEKELIQRFFDGLEKFQPTLISWNGGGFDLPVLHYRAMRHGVNAYKYWDVGENDRDYKWNNYLNRFHWRHIDLMDVLAGYQARANAPLDEIAVLLGYPGKFGMSGASVWPTFCSGGINEIRDYCETDVLNTYLVYLNWELNRGNLEASSYAAECEVVRDHLQSQNKDHLNSFLASWNNNAAA
ncbi:MAG: putative PolB exonuclease-like 3'-5' exonuclease [Parasphingorhabdus sp.]|jgi:predicted PolB exonuclease-like 3'-5' exonuclease